MCMEELSLVIIMRAWAVEKNVELVFYDGFIAREGKKEFEGFEQVFTGAVRT